MWIVPKAGLKVRDPVSMQHLPESGYEVSDTDQHWNRCLASGDVTRGVAPSAPTTPVEADPTEAAAPMPPARKR